MYKQNKAHCISLVTGSPQRPDTRIHSEPTEPLPEQEAAQGALQYSMQIHIQLNMKILYRN